MEERQVVIQRVKVKHGTSQTKAGFSIVQWTGDGNTATIGHGLMQPEYNC